MWRRRRGGGDDDDSGVTYTGLTTPAVITNANAKTLAEGVFGGSTTGTAFGVVSDEQEIQSNPTTLDIARIMANSVTRLDISPASATLPGTIQTVKEEEDCSDGGKISLDLRVDDDTPDFDFSGSYDFINCAEEGTTIDGDTNVSGSLFGDTLYLTFNSLNVVSGAESYTMSGAVDTFFSGSSVTITMDVRARNNNTQLVEWLNNLAISMTDNGSYLRMTITGRYYHPEQGYVDTVTNMPFQINIADQWPNVGQMTMTGASGSKTRLTANSNTQYTLEVDADGDGTYETTTTEDWG